MGENRTPIAIWLTRTGWIVTGIWLVLVLWYGLAHVGWRGLRALSANELGDFVAGAAAPLAFFWFVLAFLLQGEELKLQRKELELQREEQKKSREALEKQEKSITANERHARRDTFFRFLDLIEREMNDLVAQFVEEGGVSKEAHWDKYYHGNRYVFFSLLHRLLSSHDGRFSSLTVRRPELNCLLKRYCDLFEKLVSDAPDPWISSVLFNSPMGQAYSSICTCLDRKALKSASVSTPDSP